MCNGRTVEELFDPSKIEKKYLGKFSILVADSQRRSIGNRNENLQGAHVCTYIRIYILATPLYRQPQRAPPRCVGDCVCVCVRERYIYIYIERERECERYEHLKGMYVCIYVCMYIRMYAHTHRLAAPLHRATATSTFKNIYIYIHIQTHTHTNTHIHTYMYIDR